MLIRHVIHTVRLLRKSPGFTATAVLTLALGVGANTAVFSVVDAVLLRPLPYAAPDRLVTIALARTGGDIAPGNLADYQRAHAFEGLAGYDRTSLTLTGSGAPEQVRAEAVTWSLFDVVGVQPALGRAFRPDDDRPGAERVVILQHALWLTKFGADPSVLGRQVMLNGLPAVVIGVMPEGFEPLTQPSSGFTIHARAGCLHRRAARRPAQRQRRSSRASGRTCRSVRLGPKCAPSPRSWRAGIRRATATSRRTSRRSGIGMCERSGHRSS